MTIETATILKLFAPVAPKVAKILVQQVQSKLNPSDLAKALQAGVEAAQRKEDKLQLQQQLFYSSQTDGAGGVKAFLQNFFEQSGVQAELLKPLQNEGLPDVDFLQKEFERVVANYHQVIPQTERIKPWLKNFKEGYFQKTSTFLEFQVAKENYLQQLANWFDDVKFAGIAVPGQEVEQSEKLAQIFVMPDVQEETANRRGEVWREAMLSRQQQLLQEQRESALLDYSGRKFLAQELLNQNQWRKVVLLGAPGSGKTTLMSYFAVMLAQQQPEKLGLDGDTDWLPILIRIRDLTRHQEISILDYSQQFAEKTLHVKALPVGFFEHWLADGRAVILLDGLDEVAEESKRYDVVQRIENFLGQFNQNRAIITSRPAGYKRDFFRTEEFPHYQLQLFDDEKMEEFINRWYYRRFQDPEEAARRKESLHKALDDNDRIKLLARNPLLLTIIALIHRYQALLPKERYKLYDKAVETLLTSWDANKELSSHQVLKYLELDDVRRLMEILAYWVHGQGDTKDKEGGTLIDKEELHEQLSREIKTLKQVQLYEAKEEATRFISLMRERTGLLNEQGQDCYAFVHKTFQEYLCAQEIDYQADNEGNFNFILEPIATHLHDSHWREVLLLLIAQQKPKKVAKAIRQILKQGSKYEQWLHRDLLFAGSCLAENPKGLRGADKGLVEEVLGRLVELEVRDREKVGERVREQVFRVLCSMYETDFEAQVLQMLKDEKIEEWRLQRYQIELGEREIVIQTLLMRLEDESENVRLGAATALDKLGKASEQVVQALIARLDDNFEWVRSYAATSLGKLGKASEQIVQALIARLEDESKWVRHDAATSLGKLGKASEQIVQALIALLEDESESLRLGAASALGKLGNDSESVMQALISLLEDKSKYVRRDAAKALGELGNDSEQVVQVLIALLEDESEWVRRDAASALGKLGNDSESVMQALISLFEDKSKYVRESAAKALGELGNDSEHVVQVLIARLEDKSEYVRRDAASALGRLGKASEQVVKALILRLDDNFEYVRESAAEALGKLGKASEQVVKALIARLDDESEYVRDSVAEALGKLGKKSDSILPLVTQWLQQNQNSAYIGNGIDALWDLVAEES